MDKAKRFIDPSPIRNRRNKGKADIEKLTAATLLLFGLLAKVDILG